MTDKNPLAHYSGVLSEAVQESAAANLPASGAAALGEYLKDCDEHLIVPDVGGAFASAFAAGFNLATSQAAPDESYPALPSGDYASAYVSDAKVFSESEMRAYVEADRARRAASVLAAQHAEKLASCSTTATNSQSESTACDGANVGNVDRDQAAPAAVAVPDERAAFEAWYLESSRIFNPEIRDWKDEEARHICLNRKDDGEYRAESAMHQWDAWQARAALAAAPAAAASDMKWREMFWAVARALNCLPSTSVDANAHVYLQAEKYAAIAAQSTAAAAPVVLPEPAPTPCRSMFATQREYADAMEQHRKNLAEIEAERALLAGVSAPAAQPERKYICPVRTIADLVNNLMLMDQALPIYGAQYIEHPPGKRRAIAVPPTVSIERVKDSRWIGEGEALNTAIIWTRAEQPEAQAVAMPFEPRPTSDAFLAWWEPYELSEHWFVELHKIARDAWNAALSSPQAQADARDAGTVRAIVEKLPRYTYGFKGDDWGMNQSLRSYESTDGAFLRRDEVLAAIAAQAAQQGGDKQ